MGCNKSSYKANSTITSTVAVNNTVSTGWTPNFRNPIEGIEGISGAPDILTLSWAKGEYPLEVVTQASQVDPVVVKGGDQYKNMVEITGLEKGSVVSVSNCEAIAVFMVENNVPTSASLSVSLSHDGSTSVDGVSNISPGIEYSFGDHIKLAYVHKVEAVQYSIDTKVVDGKTVSSLYARKIGQAAPGDELIQGVEDFQVEYGEDLVPFDGSADRYLSWSNTLESQRITSIRVSLRINSGKPMSDSGGAASSNDLAKDLVFTVKLRNRSGA